MKDDRWCILEFSTTPEPNTGSRHCEERSYEAIHKPRKAAGLLRFARNDGLSSEAPLLSLAFGAEFLARLAVQALGVGFRRTFLGLCLFGAVAWANAGAAAERASKPARVQQREVFISKASTRRNDIHANR